MAISAKCEVKVREAVLDPLVAKRLARLTLKRTNLTGNFLDHVGHTGEIGID